MVWKEAISPTQATSARSLARASPKVVRKPSSNGSPDTASLKAPGATDELSHRIRPAETNSVAKPAMMPRGMSRLGSFDSSAASGNCSMAEQPDGEGQGPERSLQSERQPGAIAPRQLD